MAEVLARCLNVQYAYVFRYEDGGVTIVAVAAFADAGVPDHAVGERFSTDGDNTSSKVWRTRRVARMDSRDSAVGSIAERVRLLGLRSRVGAPIVVDDRVWGIAAVGNSGPDPLPADTEDSCCRVRRLGGHRDRRCRQPRRTDRLTGTDRGCRRLRTPPHRE